VQRKYSRTFQLAAWDAVMPQGEPFGRCWTQGAGTRRVGHWDWALLRDGLEEGSSRPTSVKSDVFDVASEFRNGLLSLGFRHNKVQSMSRLSHHFVWCPNAD
jgi:hypothetical protein